MKKCTYLSDSLPNKVFSFHAGIIKLLLPKARFLEHFTTILVRAWADVSGEKILHTILADRVAAFVHHLQMKWYKKAGVKEGSTIMSERF
jgi:hypothetical protein